MPDTFDDAMLPKVEWIISIQNTDTDEEKTEAVLKIMPLYLNTKDDEVRREIRRLIKQYWGMEWPEKLH